MPYCITLRSRTDTRITGWYAGRNTRWSTDHARQKRFHSKREAAAICDELRGLYPRNAKVINIEVAEGDPNPANGSRLERAPAAERMHQEGASPLEATDAKTSPPLAPAVGWTAALLGSLGLWWGIWSVASALISAL